MKVQRPFLVLALLFCALVPSLNAVSTNDLVRAQKVLAVVVKLTEAYQQNTVQLTAPVPVNGSTGKYLLPINSSGALTPWAEKTLTMEVGALLGEKAGEKAADAVASKIPLGGFLGGAAKKKGKELGVITALGGIEFIKANTELSFDSLEDYSVYLHVKGASAQAVHAAMTLYPKLEDSYPKSIKAAYKSASK